MKMKKRKQHIPFLVNNLHYNVAEMEASDKTESIHISFFLFGVFCAFYY